MATKAWQIEGVAVGGVDMVANSLAYVAIGTERHLHSSERWFGAALLPDGEDHVADRIGTATAALQADAGNDTWGAWLQILGADDSPADVGMTHFDLHELMVVAAESANAVHFVQIAYGDTGDGALVAGTYTEFVFKPQSVQGQETMVGFQTRRYAASTKVWVRLWAVGANTSTIDFFFGLHEYVV